MHRQTAVDALIDAGRDVVSAVGTERSRPAAAGPTDSAEPIAVGALLVLAVPTAPILVVAIVGYAVALARDPDLPGFELDDWVTIATAGARGTALLVGATLPFGAVLGGSGVLDINSGLIVLGSAPGPALGVAIAALAVVTWHAAVTGTAAVAAGQRQGVARGARFGRSTAGIRLSAALAGLGGAVGIVGFGLTAIPVVGPVAAAICGGVGVVIAGRLTGSAVARSDLRGKGGQGTGRDRLAVPTDSAARSRRGTPVEETVQSDDSVTSGAVQPTATRRQSRRGRP